MKRTKILLVIGALTIAGGVSAQTVLQPIEMKKLPGNRTQMQTMPNDKAAGWFPEMERMEQRIDQLETQVAQSNQQMAVLRAEIGMLSREDAGDKGE